jgi:signal transduction histidine kinase
VALRTVIAEAAAACTPLAREQHVMLEDRVSDSIGGLTILADRRRLVQVFENLLKNAIQHAPAETDVTIVDGPSPAIPTEATVAVIDHGPGFRAEDLAHLFEPFFTRRTGGTGLGLAIVRRILEDHGGSIQAENARAGGASVRVTLPVHETGPAGEG